MPARPAPTPSDDDATVIAQLQHWLTRAVIGLNLCPFAKSVHVRGQIRYVVSPAADAAEAMADLKAELAFLAAADAAEIDTTLLAVPHALADFSDYNDALYSAEKLLKRMRLGGILQIASFHPDYQFDGSEPGDVENYTNRAPYPVFHLLREDSVERAVEAYPDTDAIYERNQERLRELGVAGWQAWMEGEGDA
jgi:hypothetical protein